MFLGFCVLVRYFKQDMKCSKNIAKFIRKEKRKNCQEGRRMGCLRKLMTLCELSIIGVGGEEFGESHPHTSSSS